MFDEVPGSPPTKGWNRASLSFRSRKGYRPNVRTEDLLMPSGLGGLRMLMLCVPMAAMMTFLYVWTLLMIVNFFVPVGATVYAAMVGGGAVLILLLLYFFGTRETRRDRELARRL